MMNLDNIEVDNRFASIFSIMSMVGQLYDKITTDIVYKLFCLQSIDHIPRLILLNYNSVF